jgi:hypothetical protein
MGCRALLWQLPAIQQRPFNNDHSTTTIQQPFNNDHSTTTSNSMAIQQRPFNDHSQRPFNNGHSTTTIQQPPFNNHHSTTTQPLTNCHTQIPTWGIHILPFVLILKANAYSTSRATHSTAELTTLPSLCACHTHTDQSPWLCVASYTQSHPASPRGAGYRMYWLPVTGIP